MCIRDRATELQFNHASFGPDYATEGLYALMKLSYFRSAYELAVHRLAARIVQVAEETVIPVGRRLEFNGLPSAFNVTAPTKQLRISVLAYHQGELPADRNPDYYGCLLYTSRPVGSPIAQHAVRLARQLGFQPTVHEFDDEAESIIGGAAEAPGLLLLDRWALRDPRRRELVRRFDRSDTTWVSVLEPWNTDDPECEERAGEMGELSDDALRITRRAGRPSFLGVTGPTGLRTLEDFDDALPRAAMKAKYAFEGRTRAEPEEPPPPRPSLRDAFRRSGGGAGGGGNGNDRDDSHSNGHDGNGRSNGHDGNGRSNGHDRDNHHDPYREHDPYRDDGDDPDDGMAPLGGRGNR